MNQMAPGMQIFETTVCWKNWALEADYNQKPPKLKEITATLAAISVLFLLLPVLLAGMVPRMSFGALGEFCRSRTPHGSHIVTWHVQTLVGVPKMIKRNTPRHFCDVQTKSKKSVLVGIRVNVDMSLLISKAFQGGASNVQLLVTPDLMFEKGLNPRSKKVPQGKVWNGGYPSKLSSYLHEQRSPCCPILPFFGQDASRLGRCHSRFILIESTIAIRH